MNKVERPRSSERITGSSRRRGEASRLRRLREEFYGRYSSPWLLCHLACGYPQFISVVSTRTLKPIQKWWFPPVSISVRQTPCTVPHWRGYSLKESARSWCMAHWYTCMSANVLDGNLMTCVWIVSGIYQTNKNKNWSLNGNWITFAWRGSEVGLRRLMDIRNRWFRENDMFIQVEISATKESGYLKFKNVTQ